MISAAGFERALVAEFLETPFAVVGFDEGGDGRGQFGALLASRAVGAAVDDLLFDRAVEAFDDAVGFRLADEGEAGGEAMEAALALEVVGEVLAAVLLASRMAQFDAPGDVRPARAEEAGDRLGDRLIGGEAIPAFADMVAEALGVPVFEDAEQPQPAVVGGPHFCAIGGPAHMGRGRW